MTSDTKRADAIKEMALSEEQVAEIDGLLKAIQAGDMGLVQGCEKLLNLLEKAALSYDSHLDPRHVGTDPENRDKAGVVFSEISLLMADILSLGWSWKEVEKATCVEIPPTDDSIIPWHVPLSEGVDEMPPVELPLRVAKGFESRV